MGVNVTVQSGNVVFEPDLCKSPTGHDVLNFRLAFDENRRNTRTGEWERHTGYVECTAPQRPRPGALALSRIVHKGDTVVVSGKLDYKEWLTADQERRDRLAIKVDEVDVIAHARREGARA